MTITSKMLGSETSSPHPVSMDFSQYSISGYLSATSLHFFKKSPSPIFITEALCSAATCFLLCDLVYLNAYSAILSHAWEEMILRFSMTPGTTSCSFPLYSPSVFSRIVTTSTSGYSFEMLGILLQGLTLANRSSSLRSERLREVWPPPIGVAVGPFRPILVRFKASRPSLFRIEPVASGTGFLMFMDSQDIGAPAASNILTTLSATSGPIPSPGIKLTRMLYVKVTLNDLTNLCIFYIRGW